MGKLRTQPLRPEEQFRVVNDERLRMSMVLLADKYSEAIRSYIYKTYQDDKLASLYRAIRAAGTYQHGGRTKVRRKIVEFPNPYVFDFCDAVLRPMYGPDWIKDTRALRHELVRVWWVVEKL